ncbi:hypothetical protein HPB49_004035 [Dermacentor silvarum]|uniref:Uncharacterized protein n=1 Tax=Dermacentor silvarum TaxID=543639 RepID=A0ACB8DTK6_DERSI|nr:hypothetical protein HPB49_004035 [Dermacentor silvarum]
MTSPLFKRWPYTLSSEVDFLFRKTGHRQSYAQFRIRNQDTFPSCYEGCVAIFFDPATFKKCHVWQGLLSEQGVWGAFGCHPHMAQHYDEDVDEDLIAALEQRSVVALGEIGLDYSANRHFLSTDYVPGCRIRKLLPGVVPTVFDEYPSYLVPSAKKPRKEPASRCSVPAPKPSKRKAEPEGAVDLPESQDDFADKKHSVCTQTANKDAQRVSAYVSLIGRLRKQAAYHRSKCSKLQQQLGAARKANAFYRENKRHASLKEAVADSAKGEKKAIFLLHQLDSYGQKRPCYPEEIIRECVVWRFLSPKGYDHARTSQLLTLPAKCTLQRYMGPSPTTTGMSPAMRERLVFEASLLSSKQHEATLIIDEASIKPNGQKSPISNTDDPRLLWLANEFTSYIEGIQENSKARGKGGFTCETFEALRFTTKSTVETARFLLRNGVNCVLTRKLNSDPIEAIFGRIRFMCGGNDMLDARAVTTALDHIIKSETSIGKKLTIPCGDAEELAAALPQSLTEELNDLAEYPDTPSPSVTYSEHKECLSFMQNDIKVSTNMEHLVALFEAAGALRRHGYEGVHPSW